MQSRARMAVRTNGTPTKRARFNPGPWWSRLDDAEIRSVVILQVDLQGHTKWMAGSPNDVETYKARKWLAERLRDGLGRLGFDQLFWAGDGGAFALEATSPSRLKQVVPNTAGVVFGTFDRWRRQYKVGESLRLRASAAWVGDVLLDRSASYWSSSRLNAFLKYEREIALADRFIITEDLKRKLLPSRRSDLFCHSYPATLPNGESITTWAHRDYRPSKLKKRNTLVSWMQQETVRSILPHSDLVSHLPPRLIGRDLVGSVIIDSAWSPEGYEGIRLEAIDDGARWFVGDDVAKWATRRDELAAEGVTGTKLAAAHIGRPLSDDPVLQLSWRAAPYVDARAFHEMLENDPALRIAHLREAIRIDETGGASGTRIVSTLSNHSVVLLKGSNGGTDVLLSHRRAKGRRGGYLNNCWSVSFEEQYNPRAWTQKSARQERYHVADSDIRGSIERGLREELVGSKEIFNDLIEIRTVALQMETMFLNFGFLSIVRLPETTFETLVDIRSRAVDTNDPIDWSEHDALAVIPLDDATIGACLASDRLPRSLFAKARRCGEVADDGHSWHPTSRARLALALWYLQEGLRGTSRRTSGGSKLHRARHAVMRRHRRR